MRAVLIVLILALGSATLPTGIAPAAVGCATSAPLICSLPDDTVDRQLCSIEKMSLGDAQRDDDSACISSTKECLDSGRWGVHGSVSGTIEDKVTFTVDCGGVEIGSCEAFGGQVPCDSGLKDSKPGELGCWYTVDSGDPDNVSGFCYDPVDLSRFVVAVRIPA